MSGLARSISTGPSDLCWVCDKKVFVNEKQIYKAQTFHPRCYNKFVKDESIKPIQTTANRAALATAKSTRGLASSGAGAPSTHQTPAKDLFCAWCGIKREPSYAFCGECGGQFD